jgi:hypothetical protein
MVRNLNPQMGDAVLAREPFRSVGRRYVRSSAERPET